MTSKITSLASPNEIIVGENAFDLIGNDQKKFFIDLTSEKESNGIV